MTFAFYRQLNTMDCGPTCILMVAKYYGKHYNADTLRNIAGYNKEGVSLLGISETAERIGFRTRGVQLSIEQLRLVNLPCILHWDQNHFGFLLIFSDRRRGRGKGATIVEAAKGILPYSKSEYSLKSFLLNRKTIT